MPKNHSSVLTSPGFCISVFDTVDAELEAAQTLCEVGAHQVLRYGDCRDELGGTKQRFESMLELAHEQVVLLQQEPRVNRHDLAACSEPQPAIIANESSTTGLDPVVGPTLVVDDANFVRHDGVPGHHFATPLEPDTEDGTPADEVLPIDISTFRGARRRAPGGSPKSTKASRPPVSSYICSAGCGRDKHAYLGINGGRVERVEVEQGRRRERRAVEKRAVSRAATRFSAALSVDVDENEGDSMHVDFSAFRSMRRVGPPVV